MRKKVLSCILMLSVVLVGCSSSGVSQEEYDKVVAERDALKEQVSTTEGDGSENAAAPQEIQETPVEEEKTEYNAGDLEFDYENMHVKYVSHEFGQNMADEQTLIVYFEFTNNSSENKSFAYSFSAKAFQNGVELDSSLMFSNDTCKNRDNEIQPGTTITVGKDFVIGEDRSDVSLQIEPFMSFTNETLMDIGLALQ